MHTKWCQRYICHLNWYFVFNAVKYKYYFILLCNYNDIKVANQSFYFFINDSVLILDKMRQLSDFPSSWTSRLTTGRGREHDMIQPQTVDPNRILTLKVHFEKFLIALLCRKNAIAIWLHMQSLSNAMRLKCPNKFFGVYFNVQLLCSFSTPSHLILFCDLIFRNKLRVWN